MLTLNAIALRNASSDPAKFAEAASNLKLPNYLNSLFI
jgi:CO dehydrogenase/acetyl-CoA synthase gamma subunit (corrinoid Fe-S protein)